MHERHVRAQRRRSPAPAAGRPRPTSPPRPTSRPARTAASCSEATAGPSLAERLAGQRRIVCRHDRGPLRRPDGEPRRVPPVGPGRRPGGHADRRGRRRDRRGRRRGRAGALGRRGSSPTRPRPASIRRCAVRVARPLGRSVRRAAARVVRHVRAAARRPSLPEPPARAPQPGAGRVGPVGRSRRVRRRPSRGSASTSRAGDTYQVNHTLRLRARVEATRAASTATCATRSAARYAAYLNLGRYRVLSASPELFFRIDGDRRHDAADEGHRPAGPLARRGRGGRGEPPRLREGPRRERDDRRPAAQRPRAGSRGRARCAWATCSRPERYETVWQLTSTVTARRSPRGGARRRLPRAVPVRVGHRRAQGRARCRSSPDLEDSPRGVYCGAVGFLAPRGRGRAARRASTSRSARWCVDAETGTAEYGVGGGITWDSTRRRANTTRSVAKARVLTARRPPFDCSRRLAARPRRPAPPPGPAPRPAARLRRVLRVRAIDEDAVRGLARARGSARSPTALARIRAARWTGRGTCRHGRRADRAASTSRSASRSTAATRSTRPTPACSTRPRRGPLRGGARHGYPDADDVVLVNTEGELTETTIANLAVGLGRPWWTPPRSARAAARLERAALLEDGTLAGAARSGGRPDGADGLAVLSSVGVAWTAHPGGLTRSALVGLGPAAVSAGNAKGRMAARPAGTRTADIAAAPRRRARFARRTGSRPPHRGRLGRLVRHRSPRSGGAVPQRIGRAAPALTRPPLGTPPRWSPTSPGTHEGPPLEGLRALGAGLRSGVSSLCACHAGCRCARARAASSSCHLLYIGTASSRTRAAAQTRPGRSTSCWPRERPDGRPPDCPPPRASHPSGSPVGRRCVPRTVSNGREEPVHSPAKCTSSVMRRRVTDAVFSRTRGCRFSRNARIPSRWSREPNRPRRARRSRRMPVGARASRSPRGSPPSRPRSPREARAAMRPGVAGQPANTSSAGSTRSRECRAVPASAAATCRPDRRAAGPPGPDQLGEPLGAARARDHAEADLGLTDGRVLREVPQVGSRAPARARRPARSRSWPRSRPSGCASRMSRGVAERVDARGGPPPGPTTPSP